MMVLAMQLAIEVFYLYSLLLSGIQSLHLY